MSFSTPAGKYEALSKSARGLALRMLDPRKTSPQPFSNLLAGEEMRILRRLLACCCNPRPARDLRLHLIGHTAKCEIRN